MRAFKKALLLSATIVLLQFIVALVARAYGQNLDFSLAAALCVAAVVLMSRYVLKYAFLPSGGFSWNPFLQFFGPFIIAGVAVLFWIGYGLGPPKLAGKLLSLGSLSAFVAFGFWVELAAIQYGMTKRSGTGILPLFILGVPQVALALGAVAAAIAGW